MLLLYRSLSPFLIRFGNRWHPSNFSFSYFCFSYGVLCGNFLSFLLEVPSVHISIELCGFVQATGIPQNGKVICADSFLFCLN
jgi:hypothetical protein